MTCWIKTQINYLQLIKGCRGPCNPMVDQLNIYYDLEQTFYVNSKCANVASALTLI